jgi:large subunit ribosomal protein L36
MKKRNSLRSLAAKDGAIVVRRRGWLIVINKEHLRWTARQG